VAAWAGAEGWAGCCPIATIPNTAAIKMIAKFRIIATLSMVG
jgi:hypothetical protein